MKKQFVVFGLGRFGGCLVKEFANLGVEVLAVDKDIDRVNEYSKYVTHSVQANALDELTLKRLGLRNFDHAFVSFGEDIEASILTSLVLKEIGIPQVWAKAYNSYHDKVLQKIGVDRVIQPERDMANRIAHRIVSDKIIDYIELSKEYSIAEIEVTDKINNKTLLQLDIRAKYGCNIVGIQRGQDFMISPAAEENIQKGDILIVIGQNQDINRFEQHGV
ncbi:potassium channel family protein [Ferdinandcohnia quinoae]|uniref:TrkA family potassium uptake protein n=1 Tax=Fredinandcohnia quinoae TaxID=2918902 RepID=A0AAW5E382_9BACI|nr:TrkA family potassium uptake protein [Fredinandcohnia sp. SECRCQ15]MCH1627377.1 TrkA family potassium uptake protein [Fredinandcohnia sp. SECRCQ15]